LNAGPPKHPPVLTFSTQNSKLFQKPSPRRSSFFILNSSFVTHPSFLLHQQMRQASLRGLFGGGRQCPAAHGSAGRRVDLSGENVFRNPWYE
jgi:hypothetical protein